MIEDDNDDNNNRGGGILTILLTLLFTAGLFSLSFLPFIIAKYVDKLEDDLMKSDQESENKKK